MKNTAIEKLSYTEVTKNISQAEYNQTQEEYILSKSPDKYMISLPVKVLMFEGAKDSSPFTYYFYMENDEDLYLMQRKRNGSVVDKTKIPLTKEQGPVYGKSVASFVSKRMYEKDLSSESFLR